MRNITSSSSYGPVDPLMVDNLSDNLKNLMKSCFQANGEDDIDQKTIEDLLKSSARTWVNHPEEFFLFLRILQSQIWIEKQPALNSIFETLP